MPEIKNMKYEIGLGEETIATVSIPKDIYEQLTQDQLFCWINDIASSCPAYAEYKSEIKTHAQAKLIEPDYVEEPAF